MPRFRFTIRRMMVAVAIVGLALGGVELKRRRDRFLRRVASHTRGEVLDLAASLRYAEWDEQTGAMVKTARGTQFATKFAELQATAKSRAASRHRQSLWHAKLKRKYQEAARYPWLSVAPDPLEPR